MPDFRFAPEDEHPHPVEPVVNFNESVYVNGFDHRRQLGGWLRIGNRVNEGYAEVSVCLYLPGGRVACHFGRPEIGNHEAFAAGGLRYEVLEPTRQVAARYQGPLSILDDPSALHRPREALGAAPRVDAEIDWTFRGVSPIHGGEPDRPDVEGMYGRDFARGHFNQHGAVSGRLQVGTEVWELDGFGWRDHSWGPRSWQAIPWYRLLLGNVAPADGFMLLQIAKHPTAPDRFRTTGVLLVDGHYHAVDGFTLETDWKGDEQSRLRAVVCSSRGTDVIEGHVLSVAPLRNRRIEDGVERRTRIAEGFTRWAWAGRTGLGMTEYLDLVAEGRPVGVPLRAGR